MGKKTKTVTLKHFQQRVDLHVCVQSQAGNSRELAVAGGSNPTKLAATTAHVSNDVGAFAEVALRSNLRPPEFSKAASSDGESSHRSIDACCSVGAAIFSGEVRAGFSGSCHRLLFLFCFPSSSAVTAPTGEVTNESAADRVQI